MGCSDEAKPVCTTAYFVDNYAFFTCGNGDSKTQVSAFYHAASELVESSLSQQLPARSSSMASHRSGVVVVGGGSEGTSNKSNSSAPIGAIVGGVLGGVAVIVLAVFLISLVLHKQRKAKSVAGKTKQLGQPSDSNGASQGIFEKPGIGYQELPAPAA